MSDFPLRPPFCIKFASDARPGNQISLSSPGDLSPGGTCMRGHADGKPCRKGSKEHASNTPPAAHHKWQAYSAMPLREADTSTLMLRRNILPLKQLQAAATYCAAPVVQ